MTTFNVDLRGERPLQAALQHISRRLGDLSPLTLAVATALYEQNRLNFPRQRDPWGNPWKPLSPATLKQRRQGRSSRAGAQILRDTGRLMNSLGVSPQGENALFGTVVDYADIHQFGQGRVPARPFLPLTLGGVKLPPEQDRTVKAVLEHFIEETLSRGR